jgi:putative ABC transport system substrate-binding protein
MLCALPVSAAEVLILQSNASRGMEQMTRLVQNDCAGNHRTLVLSEYAEIDLARLVREERPAAVVAIGDQALVAAKKLRRVPVIYTMALNSNEDALAENVSGVSMMVSPKSYLKLFSNMKLHRIGVIYNKSRTGPYLRRALDVANEMGIELVALPVNTSRDVQQRLLDLQKRKVNALWLIADSVAVTSETVDSYFEFAQKNDLPLIGFSQAYLAKGALAAVELTRQDIGKQLCTKVKLARSGGSTGTTDIPGGKLLVNTAVADRLGLRVPSSAGTEW